MNELIKVNDLKADKDKVRTMVEEVASTYGDPEEVINYYYGDEKQLASVESAVLEDQIVDFILDQAKVTSNEVSYEEAIKPPAAPAENASDEEK